MGLGIDAQGSPFSCQHFIATETWKKDAVRTGHLVPLTARACGGGENPLLRAEVLLRMEHLDPGAGKGPLQLPGPEGRLESTAGKLQAEKPALWWPSA